MASAVAASLLLWGCLASPSPEPSCCGCGPVPGSVFSDQGVHRISFTLSAEARAGIDSFEKPEVHAAMDFDGVAFPDIGLRLKGSGSYDFLAGKPAFNVDLNQWVRGTRLDGLKAFRLHNGRSWDPTRTHEWLAYELARAAGLLAPRVGFALVTVDGEPYGLYVLVEKHDDVMIAARDPAQQDQGAFLEPWNAFGDFGIGALDEDGAGRLAAAWDEGPEPPPADAIETLLALDAALAREPTEESLEDVWAVVDRDRFLDYMAWEAVARHQDGYRQGSNWRLFLDCASLGVEWAASGADFSWTYGEVRGVVALEPGAFLEGLPTGVGGRAFHHCIAVPSCRRDYARHVLDLIDLAEAIALREKFEALSARLASCIASDPKPLFDAAAVLEANQATRAALTDGLAVLRKAVRAEYPDLDASRAGR